MSCFSTLHIFINKGSFIVKSRCLFIKCYIKLLLLFEVNLEIWGQAFAYSTCYLSIQKMVLSTINEILFSFYSFAWFIKARWSKSVALHHPIPFNPFSFLLYYKLLFMKSSYYSVLTYYFFAYFFISNCYYYTRST